MQGHFICPTCGQNRPNSMRVPGARLHGIVRQRMLEDVPDWDGKVTCRADRKSLPHS